MKPIVSGRYNVSVQDSEIGIVMVIEIDRAMNAIIRLTPEQAKILANELLTIAGG